jgi:restriction system protein
MIAELLRNDGYEVELTKKTRDNGFDILALRKIDRLGSPLKFLVECKRYANRNPVGVEIIRSFKEVLSTENANRGIIATTSYFTKDAIKKRTQTPYLLDYRDKGHIIEWVAQYYAEKLNKK